MNKLFLLLSASITLFGKTYPTEIEPFRTHFITSQVSGNVELVDFSTEDTVYHSTNNNNPIILIDNFAEVTEKAILDEKISNFTKIISLKIENLNGLKNSSSKSTFEKNNAELEFLSFQNQHLDMLQRRKFLVETLSRKFITADGFYINEILVSPGEFTTPGSKLLKVSDIRNLVFRVFLSADEVLQLKKNGFTINSKKEPSWHIRSSSLVKNEQHISSYEVIFDSPFSEGKIGKTIQFEINKDTK